MEQPVSVDNLLQATQHRILGKSQGCREDGLRVCAGLGKAGDEWSGYPQASCRAGFPEGCGGLCRPVIHMAPARPGGCTVTEIARHVDNFPGRRYNAAFALSIKTLS